LIHSVLIALFCIVVGTVIGFLYAIHETRSIAESVKQHSPHDPLDLLPILGMAITLIGMVLGTIAGFV